MSECDGCAAKFSFSVRKHHCRACGDIFCDACSWRRMVLPNASAPKRGKKQRMCASCAVPLVMSTSVVPTAGGEMVVTGLNLGQAGDKVELLLDSAPVIRMRGHRGDWSKLMGTYERVHVYDDLPLRAVPRFALRLARPFRHPYVASVEISRALLFKSTNGWAIAERMGAAPWLRSVGKARSNTELPLGLAWEVAASAPPSVAYASDDAIVAAIVPDTLIGAAFAADALETTLRAVDGLQFMRFGPPTKLRCVIPPGVGVDHPLTIRLPSLDVETIVRFKYCPPIVDNVVYLPANADASTAIAAAGSSGGAGGGAGGGAPTTALSGVPTEGGVVLLRGQNFGPAEMKALLVVTVGMHVTAMQRDAASGEVGASSATMGASSSSSSPSALEPSGSGLRGHAFVTPPPTPQGARSSFGSGERGASPQGSRPVAAAATAGTASRPDFAKKGSVSTKFQWRSCNVLDVGRDTTAAAHGSIRCRIPAGVGVCIPLRIDVGGQSTTHMVSYAAPVSCLLFTVTFHANHAHSLTRSP